MLSYEEVSKHKTKDNCWVIIHGKVYDVTHFLNDHPGGSAIILKYAGRDATKAFDPVHPSDTLTKYLPGEFHLGEVDPTSKKTTITKKERTQMAKSNARDGSSSEIITKERNSNMVDEFDVEYDEQIGKEPTIFEDGETLDTAYRSSQASNIATPLDDLDEDDEPLSEHEKNRRIMEERKPQLGQMYNLHDFEHVARNTMELTAWAYYSSGSDDEIALRNNHLAYQRILFKPKILVDVTNINLSTKMLGCETSVPFYITATALGKLGHPDGEKVLTRAASQHGVIQMIPTLASCSFDEIVDEATPKQSQWFQLYVNSDRDVTKKLVQHAELRGVKGLFITVDAPQLGRREKDMRSKNIQDLSHVQGDDEDADRSQGAARAISSFIDTSLNWNDIAWFRSITKMPILLKGVQRVEDGILALKYGLDGIVISNHGGRQLDSVKPPIEVLAELQSTLRMRKMDKKMEVFIDGGVRRGSDVIKAIALGATGVGIGRPFLYAMSTYGDHGVSKAIQILKDEMVMNMRLLGARSVDELNETFIDTSALDRPFPEDKLFNRIYEPLATPEFVKESKL